MSANRIIVTGGTGFIGSHTVVELISKGYEVLVADDLSNSRKEVLDSIKKITGVEVQFQQIDLCDAAATKVLFNKFKPDAVIHFAAKKLVGESVDFPVMYYRTNLVSLMNVIEAVSESGCKGIVFSSSCTVYGQPKDLPVNELSPLQKAESPYGNTKKISEDILADSVNTHHYKAISLRYFNPVGAHKSALIGEYPLAVPSNLMPVMTQTAIGLRKSFFVFGNDYQTPDGTCIRDYIHVVDLAEAHVAAINRLINQENIPAFDIFNIGTGKGSSVMEMINSFETINKLRLSYTVTSRRPGDVEQVWADTSKANKVLQWTAKRSIDDMCRDAWAWEQKLKEMNI